MKNGLVLEGGGLRGAYTAGVCAWFIRYGISFDVHVGISSGALFAIAKALEDESILHGAAVEHSVQKRNVGLLPMLLEGRPVGYNYLFDTVLPKKLKLNATRIRGIQSLVEYGVYDLKAQETFWLNQSQIDEDMLLLKAACTLPIAGRDVRYQGRLYMDGGVNTMIPIERCQTHNVDKMIIVITKPANFIRKDNSKLTQTMLDLMYRKYPKLLKEFRLRKDVYNREMALAKEMNANGQAILIQPSQDFGAKRFKATHDQVQGMYNLGLEDCEKQKESILAYLK
jgi:predicted patatin/cPLA2 family phospholipase